MTIRSNIESSKIESLIPRQLIADAGGLIEFIKEYYRFMHEEQGPSHVINNVLSNKDIDTVVDAFISLVEKEIGAGFTTNLAANKTNLYKNIVQFYQAKGSTESFKLLFRLLYDTDIDISFPKEKILVASDGRWIQQNSIFIEVTEGDPFDLFANIIDVTTPDRVVKVEVERIRRVEETAFYEIFITKDNNTLRVVTGSIIDQYGVKATVVNSLNKYEIYHPGTDFEIAQFVDVNQSTDLEYNSGELIAITSIPSASFIEKAITVATGTNSYGTGNKFYIDGLSGASPDLDLVEGKTYRLDQSDSTNSLHPIRFSETPNGTGTEYTTGVTYVGTPGTEGAYTQIVLEANTPVLYYYCGNHSGMGGTANTIVGATENFFQKELTVNGIRLVSAGAIGGQDAVPDEWVKKTARVIELLIDPTGAGINEADQRKLIKTLSGDAGTLTHPGIPTLQRIAYGGGSEYTPSFLTDSGTEYWNLNGLYDTHVQDDMVWYKNISGPNPSTSDRDIEEIIEHLFHTIHNFGIPGAVAASQAEVPMAYLTTLIQESPSFAWQATQLHLAMKEVIDAGLFDPSGYAADWDTDPAAAVVAYKEYTYLLNWSMWDMKEFWENESLAPEWSDTLRTPAFVLANNPLGYALFNTYFAPVLSKPDFTVLKNIFQANDAGESGYTADDIASGAGVKFKVTKIDAGTGALEEIKFINFGVNYSAEFYAMIIPRDQIVGGVDLIVSQNPAGDKIAYPSRAIIKFSESVLAEYRGEYSTNNGFLSDDIYLQDNFFYQQFSYLIRSSQQFDNYKDIVNKTVHPSGMAMFGEFEINNSFDMSRAFELLRRYFTNREEDAIDTIDLNVWTLYKPREDVAYASTTDWFYDFYKNVSEIVNVPDPEFKDFFKVLGDTALTSDELTYAITKLRDLVENLAISELAIVSYAKTLTEVINSNDSGVIEILGDIYAEDYFAEDYSEGLTSFT